jgi:hypothetical protein
MLMPPYVCVKIMWPITSYSKLFILKRNTGNCFTFYRTDVSQESFLKKSVRKRCLVFLFLFNFIDVRSLRSVKMSLKFESLSCSKNSNNISAQFNANIFLRGTVNRSPDNRGSTVYLLLSFNSITQWDVLYNNKIQ